MSSIGRQQRPFALGAQSERLMDMGVREAKQSACTLDPLGSCLLPVHVDHVFLYRSV